MFKIYILGVAMGLFAAAMPGPINLEVVRRSISRGAKAGAFFGCGAVTADLIYVTAASMGAAAIVTSLPAKAQAAMWLVGSIILMIIGITALRAKSVPKLAQQQDQAIQDAHHEPSGSLIKGYFIGLILTLSSPTTIAYWVTVSLSAAKITTEEEQTQAKAAYLLMAGVGTACFSWIAVAVNVAGRFHRRIEPKTYLLIERVAGIGLCSFSVYSFCSGIYNLYLKP